MKILLLILSAITLLITGCDKMEPANNPGTNGPAASTNMPPAH